MKMNVANVRDAGFDLVGPPEGAKQPTPVWTGLEPLENRVLLSVSLFGPSKASTTVGKSGLLTFSIGS